MTKKIFISYSVDDNEVVGRIKRDIQAVGHIIWIYPIAINPGEDIVVSEEKGINESDVVLIMESESSSNSEAVQKEITLVSELEQRTGLKKSYFVRIDPAYPLTKTTIQRIDLSGEVNYVSEFYRLMRKIDDHKDFEIKYESKAYSRPEWKNWYNITVWIEGAGMNQIKEVDYHLHHAIANDPETKTKNKIGEKNFCLKFDTITDEYVCAIIYLKNKTKQIVVEQILI